MHVQIIVRNWRPSAKTKKSNQNANLLFMYYIKKNLINREIYIRKKNEK